MVHGVRLLVVSILLVVGCGQNARRNTFEVTYIANEGFLITMGDTKVLVDALPSSPYYANPSANIVAKLMNDHP